MYLSKDQILSNVLRSTDRRDDDEHNAKSELTQCTASKSFSLKKVMKFSKEFKKKGKPSKKSHHTTFPDTKRLTRYFMTVNI